MNENEIRQEDELGEKCPKCGSSHIECGGKIADGELIVWKCHDCGHHWEERC